MRTSNHVPCSREPRHASHGGLERTNLCGAVGLVCRVGSLRDFDHEHRRSIGYCVRTRPLLPDRLPDHMRRPEESSESFRRSGEESESECSAGESVLVGSIPRDLAFRFAA